MESRFLLDIVVTQGTSIFQLFSSEDQTLLVWWDSFFVLNFSLDVLNSITWFHFQCNGLSSQGLDEDLHTTTKSEHKMESRFLLDIVVTQGTSIFQLFSSEDQTLLVWWDSFFVLNFSLDILNSVTWFHFQCNGLSSQGLDKDLHTTSKSEHKMQSRFLLDIVVTQGTPVFQLFSSKD